MDGRLQQILDTLGIKQTGLARELGVSEGTVRGLLSGRVKTISGEILVELQQRYKINPLWLVKGVGEMFLGAVSASPVQQAKEPATSQIIIPSDEDFIPLYNALPDGDRKEVRAFTGWRATLKGISVPRKGSKVKEPSAPYSAKVVDLSAEMEVPLLGQIAAGNPIFASDNVEQILHLPQGVAKPRGRRLFALRVRGESMIGAGIHNGDFALLREVVSPLDEVASGDIVAAVIGTDATLKRVFFEDHSIILKAENPAFKPDRKSVV